MEKQTIKVGLLGFGTVGSGMVKTLLKNQDLINRRAGKEIQLAMIADLDLDTDRGVNLNEFPGLHLTQDGNEVVNSPDIDLVVETIGGKTIARELVLKALKAGKDVVTANKSLLAEHGEEVFGTAISQGRRIGFEGAVGGGIPIIETLDGPLAGSQVTALWGILNGTCNYILTKMEDGAGDFATVLQEAQELGYAEQNPSLDVDGHDTAHKIALLASIAFGQRIDCSRISVEGITRIEEVDVLLATMNGYRIKLLGMAKRSAHGIEVRVHPVLIPQDHQLAQVRDVFNALYLIGDPVGGILLYGSGAGSLPTGSAVVSDLIQLARGENSEAERYKVFTRPGEALLPAGQSVSHHYVRISVNDDPDALNTVMAQLGQHRIAVNMAERIATSSGKKIIIITSACTRKALHTALKKVHAIPSVLQPPYAIAIEEIGE